MGVLFPARTIAKKTESFRLRGIGILYLRNKLHERKHRHSELMGLLVREVADEPGYEIPLTSASPPE